MFYVAFSAVVVLINAIFLSDRFFGAIRVGRGGKGIGGRLLELMLIFALLLIGLGRLEAGLHGSAYAQGWEFYAIAVCVMLVSVFPGFVFRYLWKRNAA